MSYLPYSRDGFFGWAMATGSSLLVHGAVVALGFGGFLQLVAQPPQPAARPDYTITLERLDSDTLAGLLERQATDAPADPDAPAQEDTDEGPSADQLALAAPPAPAAPATAAPEEDLPEAAATEEPEPETTEAEATEPEVIEPESTEPEVAAPDLPEPEVPESVVPESVAPESVVAESVVAEPIAPEEVTPQSLSPETVTPETAQVPTPAAVPAPREDAVANPLIAETLAPVSPVTPLNPVGSVGSVGSVSAVNSVAPVQTGFAPVTPQSIAPQDLSPVARDVVAASGQTAQRLTPTRQTLTALQSPGNGSLPPVGQSAALTAAPPVARQAAPPAAPPTAQDLAVGSLIARIRATPADPCLLALPRRDGADGVGLELVAATDGAMAQFASDLLTPEDAGIRQTRTLVDPRQCAALAYLRDNRDYPATRLGIALDAAEVPSGGEISGVLRGVAGRYVLLLIVDNNGVVQDLQRFMSFSGNFARFTVPVTRVGPQRDTSQSLIAITTDRPAATLRARDGQLAADVFNDLDAAQGRDAAIGFATFDVR